MNRWEAEYILRLHHKAGQSMSSIAKELHRAYPTVASVLDGRDPDDGFADLRARYEEYKPARSSREPFTDDQMAFVFKAFWDDNWSLSRIGNALDGAAYHTVRNILKGESYAEQTAGLRRKYPRYEYDRRALSFTDDDLADIFARYHGQPDSNDAYADTDVESLEAIADGYGVTRNTIKRLLTGDTGPQATAELRAKYGSEIRGRGRSSWTPASLKGREEDAEDAQMVG